MKRIIAATLVAVGLSALPAQAATPSGASSFMSSSWSPTASVSIHYAVTVRNRGQHARKFTRTASLTLHKYIDVTVGGVHVICKQGVAPNPDAPCPKWALFSITRTHRIPAHRSYRFHLDRTWSWGTTDIPGTVLGRWCNILDALPWPSCDHTGQFGHLPDWSWLTFSVRSRA